MTSSLLPAAVLASFAALAPASAHADPTNTTTPAYERDDASDDWRADDEASPAALAPRAVSAPAAPTKPLSVARRTTGQVLTVLGIAHMIAGSTVMGVFMSQRECEFCALGGFFIGAPILSTGVALTSVGIPLWVTGAKQVPLAGKPHPVDEAYVPRLHLGAGSIGISGAF